MGRSPCCDKVGLKKGPWTPEEDQKLLAYIEEHGHGSWRALPTKAGLQRCGKSCRLRWTNYLRPDIKRGKFSLQEEKTIIQLHALLGNRWSAIATHLPKRTDNEIKNYWNTHLKKRLAKMGIDPVTHKPKNDALHSCDGRQSKSAANLNHMAQWESARLEAEARLVRESKLRSSSSSSSNPLIMHHHPILKACNNGGWLTSTESIINESPTSSLSLSENVSTPPPHHVMPMIEFVGSSGSCEAGIVKEEGDHEDQLEWNSNGNNNNSISYTSNLHELTLLSKVQDTFNKTSIGDNGDDAIVEEGFTNLLLNTNYSDDRSLSEEAGSGGGGESNNCDGSGSGSDVLCELDNKNYWNSILNLVNCNSPSHSPMF